MTPGQFLKNLRFRRNLAVTDVSTTLTIATGSLTASGEGITAHLQPPFSKLSGRYSWHMFPASLVGLKILATGEECETIQLVERLFGLGERLASDRDHDCIALEESDVWCEDVDRIIRWGVGLTQVCPVASVAHDLAILPTMKPRELDCYVRSWLS